MKRFACPVFLIRNMILPLPAKIITSVISGHSKALLAQSTLINKTGLVPPHFDITVF
jgi:hypothetical protein